MAKSTAQVGEGRGVGHDFHGGTRGAWLVPVCAVLSLENFPNPWFLTPWIKIKISWGIWLAQLEGYATLDLEVLSSNTMLELEITKKIK